MMRINGKDEPIEEIVLMDYLEQNGYDARTIAVECNEAMVPRAKFAEFVLHYGDVVEIVSFMGGG